MSGIDLITLFFPARPDPGWMSPEAIALWWKP